MNLTIAKRVALKETEAFNEKLESISIGRKSQGYKVTRTTMRASMLQLPSNK